MQLTASSCNLEFFQLVELQASSFIYTSYRCSLHLCIVLQYSSNYACICRILITLQVALILQSSFQNLVLGKVGPSQCNDTKHQVIIKLSQCVVACQHDSRIQQPSSIISQKHPLNSQESSSVVSYSLPLSIVFSISCNDINSPMHS